MQRSLMPERVASQGVPPVGARGRPVVATGVIDMRPPRWFRRGRAVCRLVRGRATINEVAMEWFVDDIILR